MKRGEPPENRRCLTCGALIERCKGFCLARDLIAVDEGRGDEIREFCGMCSENGKMHAWIREHPHDNDERRGT